MTYNYLLNNVAYVRVCGGRKTYTEIMMCDSGYFYTEPSATEGGLFFHSFDGTDEIAIVKNK